MNGEPRYSFVMVLPREADRIIQLLSDTPQEGRALRAFAMEVLSRIDGYDWVGIYRLEGEDLVLDEFVGAPTDHTRIPVGTGVCGTAVTENENQVIDDVRSLSNYLACSVNTRSEIVVLIRRGGKILGQIDVDGHKVASFNRTNLFLEVIDKVDTIGQTLDFVASHPKQSGIIYCFSRKQVDDLSAYLASKGYSVRPYHAGLDDADRRRNQEAFIRDDVQIIVATIAFGMGINKPNVRFVIHHDLPKSIEGYYQEIGRAGRDGLPAHCALLYSYADVAKLNYFIDQKEGDEKRVAIEHLNAIVRYAEDERNCRRKPLLNYFGESYSAETCSNCDNCNSTPTPLTDITVLAQKFLSCVKRADEKFGAGHIVDILLGSKNEKVLRWEHDKLSTYGIGKELTRKQWMHLARQLLTMGYLKQEGEFHTLSLTPKALEALRKREPIFGVMQEAERAAKADGKKKAAELDYHRGLFALLRQKRKEMADEAGVPPYVIFSDRTLTEMAAYFPQSQASLLTISGVGQVKAQQYGEAFLEVIRGFAGKHNVQEKPKEALREKSEVGQRTLLVGELYNGGETVQSLVAKYQVTNQTILDHLTRFVQAGNTLRMGDDLEDLTNATPDQKQAVFAAFDEVGTILLKPVFERLDGALNYDDLKVLRLMYQALGRG